MTITSLAHVSVRSAKTEIWQNYDNKDFKNERIQEIYGKVSSCWKNFLSFGIWGWLTKRAIKTAIKEELCKWKTELLPSLQERVKTLKDKKALKKEFIPFKSNELALLTQYCGHKFDPATHWLGIKHYLRSHRFPMNQTAHSFDAAMRLPKGDFEKCAAYLRGQRRSAPSEAMKIVARAFVDARTHRKLLSTLPRRIQTLFKDPTAQEGFERYFLAQKWPEYPALQQSISKIRQTEASPDEQIEYLKREQRYVYTKPELASVLLSGAPEARKMPWFQFRDALREELYAKNHILDLLRPLYEIKTDQALFSLSEETYNQVVKAAVALRIYPELFPTLPLYLQKMIKEISDEELAKNFQTMIQDLYTEIYPKSLLDDGAEFTADAVQRSGEDPSPEFHPAFDRDSVRSGNKELAWIPHKEQDPISISFNDRKLLTEHLGAIGQRNLLGSAGSLMLQRLLTHDAYGPPLGYLHQALNRLTPDLFFGIGYAGEEPLSITIVENGNNSLTVRYSSDVPLTDIYHSHPLAKEDRRYIGDLHIEYSYKLVYDAATKQHRVEGPFLQPPTFTFEPLPPRTTPPIVPPPAQTNTPDQFFDVPLEDSAV